MTLPLKLEAALFLRRRGAAELAVFLMLVAAIAMGAFVLPSREQALSESLAQWENLQQGARAAESDPVAAREDRLGAFRRTLGLHRESERHIETVLAIARDKELIVRKAEYRTGFSKAGDYHTLQVTLPFQSGYGPVRGFCDEVLRALPFASIDAVLFSRNTVDVTDLDAKIILTFFLTDADLSASAGGSDKNSSTAIPRQAVIR